MYTHGLRIAVTGILLAVATSAATVLPYTAHLSYATTSNPSKVHPLATIAYDPSRFTTELESWTPPSTEVPEVSSTPDTSLPVIKVLTDSGSSTLTSIGIFNETLLLEEGRQAIIKLSLDPSGKVHNAFITASPGSPQLKSSNKLTKNGKPKSKARLEREAKEAERDRIAAEKARIRSAKKAGTTISSSAVPTAQAITTTKSGQQLQQPIQIHLIPSTSGPSPKLAPARTPRVAADGSAAPVEEEEKPEKTFFQKYWWVLLTIAAFAMAGSGEK